MRLNICLIILLSLGDNSFTLHIFKENPDGNTKLFEMIGNIVIRNLKRNGWQNILFIGEMEDILFDILKPLHLTFTVMNTNKQRFPMQQGGFYHSNVIIMSCENFEDFQKSMENIVRIPLWHPHANIVLLYNNVYDKQLAAKIFYILWYYKAVNAIIIHRKEDKIFISNYSPYSNDFYSLDYKFGCWFTGLPIKDYTNDFKCEEHCNNVTLHSNLRANHFGTCISFSTVKIFNGDYNTLHKTHLFEDKGKNLHGFTMRSYGIQVLPFLKIEEFSRNNNNVGGRDGLIWTTLAELMNFTIFLVPNKKSTNTKFNYKENIQQLYLHGQRKIDLILFPVYQFDLRIAQIDYTFPFVDSGVCFISHEAGLKQILLGTHFVEKNYNVVIEFFITFFCIWLLCFLYSSEERKKFTYDQAGKDLMNTFRMFYAISVPKLPQRESFRIFFVTALWGFVLITFMNQAAVISMFSTSVHGKNIDTFEDVIGDIQENRKTLEGMASPDVLLTKTDPKLNVIFSKLKHSMDLFECIKHLKKDKNRICLIDCSIGRYLERSEVNEKGAQYLHVARNDKVHSLYLNMILHRHSPLTPHFNRHLMALVEAGIIEKWIDCRDKVVERNTLPKVLHLNDLDGVFQITIIYTTISLIVFIIEVVLGKYKPASLKKCLIENSRVDKVQCIRRQGYKSSLPYRF